MRPTAVLLAASLALTSGGVATVAARTAPPAKDYLPIDVGDHWTMADQLGRRTTFDVLGTDSPNTLRLRITKDTAASYWWAGVAGAWVDFYLTREDGTWRSPRSDVYGPGTALSVGQEPVPGLALPYRLYPPHGATGDIVTSYVLRCSACSDSAVPWHTNTWLTSLPGWGEVLATHFCEGGPKCESAEETWYFRAGVGLVQIHDVHNTDLILRRDLECPPTEA